MTSQVFYLNVSGKETSPLNAIFLSLSSLHHLRPIPPSSRHKHTVNMERQFAILLLAVEKTGYTHLCPECLQLLRGAEARTIHCNTMGDETHQGLGLSLRKDFPQFLRCYQQAVRWDVDLTLESCRGRNSFAKFFTIQTVLLYKICESLTPLGHYIDERSLIQTQWRKANFKEPWFSVSIQMSDHSSTSKCFHHRKSNEEADREQSRNYVNVI